MSDLTIIGGVLHSSFVKDKTVEMVLLSLKTQRMVEEFPYVDPKTVMILPPLIGPKLGIT